MIHLAFMRLHGNTFISLSFSFEPHRTSIENISKEDTHLSAYDEKLVEQKQILKPFYQHTFVCLEKRTFF